MDYSDDRQFSHMTQLFMLLRAAFFALSIRSVRHAKGSAHIVLMKYLDY